jgi:hypothetical protein
VSTWRERGYLWTPIVRGVRALHTAPDTCGLRSGHPAVSLDTCLDIPVGHLRPEGPPGQAASQRWTLQEGVARSAAAGGMQPPPVRPMDPAGKPGPQLPAGGRHRGPLKRAASANDTELLRRRSLREVVTDRAAPPPAAPAPTRHHPGRPGRQPVGHPARQGPGHPAAPG